MSHIANGRVISPDVIPADAPRTWLHLVDVDGASERAVKVRLEEGVARAVPVEREALERYAAIESLPEVERATLRGALQFLAQRERLEEAQTRTEAQLLDREQRVSRLRENLGAIPAGAAESELVEEMIAKLVAVEGAVVELGEQLEEIRDQIERRDRQLTATLESLGPKED